MNTTQSYTPKTVWQGGRPTCLPPMTPVQPRVEVVDTPKTYTGPMLTCQQCGDLFGKRLHESWGDFESRKFCHMDCAYAHRNAERQARMDLVCTALPGTKHDIMNKTGFTRNELDRVLVYLVAGKIIFSEANANYPRIYRMKT